MSEIEELEGELRQAYADLSEAKIDEIRYKADAWHLQNVDPERPASEAYPELGRARHAKVAAHNRIKKANADTERLEAALLKARLKRN